MAVHQPSTRVVGLEGKDEITTTWEHGYITAGRIACLESRGRTGISTSALGKNEEIVSFKCELVALT